MPWMKYYNMAMAEFLWIIEEWQPFSHIIAPSVLLITKNLLLKGQTTVRTTIKKKEIKQRLD